MFARVIVDLSNDAVDRVFDYIALPDTAVGMRVKVPFGGRTLQGFVLSLSETTNVDESKIKSIIRNLESVPKLKGEIIDLIRYMAEHFFLRMSDCIRLALPSCVRLDNVHEMFNFKVSLAIDFDTAINNIGKRAKGQLAVVAFLGENEEVRYTDLVKMFSRSSVNALIDRGIVQKTSNRIFRHNVEVLKANRNVLTSAQKNAVDKILNNDKTFLLHGVTGSGKTEVYMTIIEEVIKQGKTAIMLVPEISLTPQMMNRFNSRFPNDVAVLHSGLSEGERFDEWDRIFNKQAHVVLGARSAIFAPNENIGVIIIDEEHDGSYVSESNPRYDTHDIAEFRARFNHCPLILGSATPSIESYKKAVDGQYTLVEMPDRINGAKMPDIEIVSMLDEIMDGNVSPFSRLLIKRLQDCIDRGKQAILFINRRGYASFVICRECGYRAKCDDCEVSLVYHKEDNELKCHFCGKRYRALTNCPKCHSSNIKYGAVGTERVEKELKHVFNVPVFRMDNDTTRGKDGHKKILENFAKTSPSILVGTQMIAKGHDYPMVEFVGILDADVSLYNSDYKSNERTFQLVTQVAGRAGRKDGDGKVVLQTYAPNHYVYKLAKNYDYNSFFERELNVREATKFPPFTKILRILVSSESDNLAKFTTKEIYDKALKLKDKYGKKNSFPSSNAFTSKENKAKIQVSNSGQI